MKNLKTRRFFAVLIMCLLTFSFGLISSVSASEVAEETSVSDTSETVVENTTEAANEDAKTEDEGSAADSSDTTTVGALEETEDEAEEKPSKFYATIFALLPPLIAIVLALITKEVYSSLFVGILVGGLLYSGFNFEGTIVHVFRDGFIASIADEYNIGIILFLIVLGAIVAMMNKSGASAAFGKWAATHIKSRVGAQLATILFGMMIFVDDYFNCLTVGSVMRPVTDKHRISRAKLAYLIDATAAPICIIAPISSWAAAVTGFVAEEQVNGFELFLRAIPFNFYALLTIVFMILLTVSKADFGPMKLHEMNALKGDLFTSDAETFKGSVTEDIKTKGKVIDLIFPVVVLIVSCIIGMIYTGGFFDGVSFINAFSDCDASQGLVFGSFVTLIITVAYFIIRRVISFKDCMGSIPEGFKAMVPAIMILACAWTLKTITDSLGAGEYIEMIVDSSAASFAMFLPAIIFLIAVGLSFATGTSWGTFGILIPLVLKVVPYESGVLSIIAISACMAGAVCGDHCSPISDTTIMASAGSNSNHINHVSTQLPYALTVAGISFVTYIIAGITQRFIESYAINAAISLGLGVVLTVAMVAVLKLTTKKTAK